MKLLFSKCNINIVLEDERPVTLVLEDPRMLSEFIGALVQATNDEKDDFILSDGEKRLSVAKNVLIELNPFEYSLNSHKILGRLYKYIAEMGNEFPKERTRVQESAIVYLDSVLNTIRFDDLTYELDFKDEDLFKMFNIHINEHGESLQSRLLSTIRVCSDLCFVPVVVFLNLGCFLSENEIQTITKYAAGQHLHLLLVESREPVDRVGDMRYIIDRDLCLITKGS